VFKKTIAVALAVVITCLSSLAQAPDQAGAQAPVQPGKAASVKARMQKIGVGDRTLVNVKLKDGTELRGYLSRIEDNSFTITDKNTKKATSASYGDVLSFARKGLSTTAKVVIIVGIGVVVTLGAIIGYAATHLKV
jgi:small nuclear ribonucleoprotein (snRNP)-like protein